MSDSVIVVWHAVSVNHSAEPKTKRLDLALIRVWEYAIDNYLWPGNWRKKRQTPRGGELLLPYGGLVLAWAGGGGLVLAGGGS